MAFMALSVLMLMRTRNLFAVIVIFGIYSFLMATVLVLSLIHI